jgi:hypothetical protein
VIRLRRRSIRVWAGLVALAAGAIPAAAQNRVAPVNSRPPVTHAPDKPRVPASQAPSSEQADVTVQTRLDRPALWVADRLTYTIEITCRRGFDILVDDLSRDKLKLEGLEIVSSDSTRDAGQDEIIRHEFRYLLTTYRVDVATPRIGPMSVRYYVKRPGQRLEDSAPAGAVQVPAATVAFRSLLPDDQPSYDVRDSQPAAARPLAFRLLAPVGLGLIILSVAPVAVLVIALVRRSVEARRGSTRRSLRHARTEAREALEAVRATDPSSPEARRDAFLRLDALVRHHLADDWGVAAPGLTRPEIAASLASRASPAPAELVDSVLANCEVARYAPPAFLPGVEAWRETLARAEQVLGARR